MLKFPLHKWGKILTVALAACGLTTACDHAPLQETRQLPPPAHEHGMTLYWGRDIKTEALSMIQQSQHFCYLDIYELSDPDILHALEAAKKRGVDVKVIVDATESHSQHVAVPELKHYGVPVYSQAIHHGISHIKMLVTDESGDKVLIGGMNFGAGSWSNNDASVYLTDPNPSFLALFHWDWERAQGHAAAAPAYQLPLLNDRTTGTDVVQAIDRAHSSVAIEAFDLSDTSVIKALEGACRRGVVVEVLLDPGQSYNRKTATILRDDGATVRFYTPYQSEWMHAKILDVDKGSTFIIGSANFSHQAYTYNHEGDLELHNVPNFDKTFQGNLSIQISRGTDYPDTKRKQKA